MYSQIQLHSSINLYIHTCANANQSYFNNIKQKQIVQIKSAKFELFNQKNSQMFSFEG